MGVAASIQTNVTNLTNKIKNEIEQKTTANASTKCTINIENINFSETNGCSIKLINNCRAEADVTMSIISEVLADFYNNIDNTQKQEAASWFTATYGIATNVNNVVNDFSNYLSQTCNAQAQTDLGISVKNVTINKCTAPEGQTLAMEFINTGSSRAICSMQIFNNLVATASSDISNKQSQGLDWSKLIWPICIAVVIIGAIYLISKLLIDKIPSNKERIEMLKNKKDNYATRISDLLNASRNYGY